MLLEEGYSHDDDQSEKHTAERSNDADNSYREALEQPRKHWQGTIESPKINIKFMCFS